ncbi:hypothetical protein B0H67DRAFT_98518 [Lasiosphaeris hirsuta]|uniref:Uncharacterized protein n=1 Tax=Lasiosphaeris hirsuta TaxID=260670 RepID=A0AA40DF40_9PEZI|nr:hypothetical protein B0H67DRAFT_98518 [Lasiosphaeris hirsuta]
MASREHLHSHHHKRCSHYRGGASGSYAAVRLKEDYNKSIVLVEKRGCWAATSRRSTIPTQGHPSTSGTELQRLWPSPRLLPANERNGRCRSANAASLAICRLPDGPAR